MGIVTDLFQTPGLTTAPGGPGGTVRARLVHGVVPGRGRFAVDALRGDESFRIALEAALRAVPGIREVHANKVSGRVLVLFDPALSHRTVLERIVRAAARAARSHRSASSPPVLREVPSEGRASPWQRAWHTLPARQAVEAFGSHPKLGLNAAQALAHRARFGPNALPRPPRRSELAIFFDQFRSLPVALLGASAAVSLLTGGLGDAVVILVVIGLNATIGYLTESQAERTIASLGALTEDTATVLRAGKLTEVASEEVVPGDILVLQPGVRVAADGRVIEATDLTVDESALTGESIPVAKTKRVLRQAELALAERVNMVYRGTVVTGGSGLAVVVATGRATELGTIQALVGETRPPETPMQRQLDQLGNQLVMISGAICAGVFVVGLLRGYGVLEMLRVAISLAVAAVPEGLPTVATTTLALGIRRMRRYNVLIRHLDAVETLGAVQVICLDKTGTLTLNRMAVKRIAAGLRELTVEGGILVRDEAGALPAQEVRRLLEVAVLCNDTEVRVGGGTHTLNGSATETALMAVAIGAGLQVEALRLAHPRFDSLYRAEGRNYMLTWHRTPEGCFLLALKGSPAEVLGLCRYWLCEGEQLELTEADRERLLAQNDAMAGQALRVLGFAYRYAESREATPPNDFIWLGMVGMADPLREGVNELIAQFHAAGIDTVMITGDQSATAYAIGRELGLAGDRPLEILDSSRLERLDPEVLKGLAQRVSIFSRVSPANKLQIVQALQRAGKVVAMTGDGINDSPALKAADIGVALGASGTSVARDVADVVLEDDELRTMIVAVREGRTIYANIRKSVHFLTATNLSEIGVMVTAIAAGLGTPLNTMQLLWINLVTDILPALALALEPAEPDVLRQPPRDPRAPIIGTSDLRRYLFEAGVITAGTLAAYGTSIARYGIGPQASSNAFMTLTLAQLLHTYSCRSERHGLFTREHGPRNRYLDLAVGGSMLLQASCVVVPGLAGLLGTTPPSPADLLTIAAGAGLPLLVNEATKPTPADPGRVPIADGRPS